MEKWFFLCEKKNSPAYNMACDELLTTLSREYRRVILRLYSWDKRAYSIGYIQNIGKLSLIPGLPVVRRMTGGGVVEHDELSFTYSLSVPKNHFLFHLSRLESYRFFHSIIARCLSLDLSPKEDIPSYVNRRTMNCFQHSSRYDLMDGKRKVSGSAQRRFKDSFLHQGVIRLRSLQELAKLPLVLKEAFSASVPCSFNSLILKKEEQKLLRNLEHKYTSEEWNFIK